MFFKYTPRLCVLNKFTHINKLILDKLIYLKYYFNVKLKTILKYKFLLRYNTIIKLLYILYKKLSFILYKFYMKNYMIHMLISIYKKILVNKVLVECDIIIRVGDYIYIDVTNNIKIYYSFAEKNFIYKNVLQSGNFIFIIKDLIQLLL